MFSPAILLFLFEGFIPETERYTATNTQHQSQQTTRTEHRPRQPSTAELCGMLDQEAVTDHVHDTDMLYYKQRAGSQGSRLIGGCSQGRQKVL